MNIVCEFGTGNYGMNRLFSLIYEEIDKRCVEVVNKSVIHKMGHCANPGGRCGSSSMIIRNSDNNKTIVLNFWDRSRDVIYANQWKDAWDDLNVVRVIGGLGVYPQILENAPSPFTPFFYVLEHQRNYEFIEELRESYDFDKKIKKACFVGNIYEHRRCITNHLQKRPDLFDIYDSDAGIHGKAYFEKMKQYALILSLNGNGEWCLRDIESMGLGIPMIRSEAYTPFQVPLLPEINYIKATDPSFNASFEYQFGYDRWEEIAAEFIHNTERALNSPQQLKEIADRNMQYYDSYAHPEKLVDEFFKLFDIRELI